MQAVKNRGIYRCGCCEQLGHTIKRCLDRPRKRRSKKHGYSNASYRRNRAIGLCDECGRPSKRRARCAKCAARRNRQPSRQPGYRTRKEYAK